MKLSKESSRLIAEYQRAQEEGGMPSYLNPEKLDETLGAVRRISTCVDEIFGQVVYKILEQNKLNQTNTITYQRYLSSYAYISKTNLWQSS